MAHLPAHDLLETAAAAVLVVGGGIHLALARLARSGAPPRSAMVEAAAAYDPPTAVPGSLANLVPASLSLAAAAVHLAAAPDHLGELGLLGLGFVVAGAFQAGWALAWLVGQPRALAWTGVAANLAIAAAWAWSRTVGLPVGPLAGTPEAAGIPDVVATLLELLLAGLLLDRLIGASRPLTMRLRDRRSLATILAVPALGIVFLATALSVALALGGDHGTGGADDHGSGVEAHP